MAAEGFTAACVKLGQVRGLCELCERATPAGTGGALQERLAAARARLARPATS